MAESKNLPATKTDERAVVYQAADGQEVKLSADVVKRYLVQGKSELVTTQELMYFLNICKSRKLNPLIKDCYLVKYGGDPAAIITSIDFFRKRARAQKDCKGWKKGVIVQDKDGNTRDSYGLVKEGETLVGGWFEALPEGWLEPFRLEVNLKGYLKKTSEGKITKFWQEDNQPSMIAKVAEAQGLRTVWPDEFQQLYEEAEAPGPGDSMPGMPPPIDIEGDEPKTFDDTIPEGTDMAALSEYIKAVAAANKITVEKVKENAAKSPDDFWKMFPAWVKQQKAKEKKKVSESADELAPAECPDRTGTIMTKAFCDACQKRQGCTVWA
jgi:phage recombination protein Bet